MADLPTTRPLPRRLADAADRLGLTPHVARWESMADGRSNHGRTEVFLLALDIEPGVVALKFAGSTPASKEALERERAALTALQPRTRSGDFPVPRLFDAPALGPGELALEYLPGRPYERFAGRAHDPSQLATDLAAALTAVWGVTDPPLDTAPTTTSLAQRLQDILDPAVEERLLAWASTVEDTTDLLVHGDLRPSNILVREEDGVLRLSGLLDWSMAAAGDPTDDQVLLEALAGPVHAALPGKLRDALPPLEHAARHRATVRLLCRLLLDNAATRDWEAFRRNQAALAEALG